MTATLYAKSPLEDYEAVASFSSDLGTSEKVASATWTIPSGLTAHDAYIATDGKSVGNYITGGTAGQKYRVDVLVTTDNAPPRKFESAFIVRVLNK